MIFCQLHSAFDEEISDALSFGSILLSSLFSSTFERDFRFVLEDSDRLKYVASRFDHWSTKLELSINTLNKTGGSTIKQIRT